MPFSAEDFARTCLVRILPRSRYRLAAQTDARFQSFASNTTRIAYRQQGGTPAFLLFAGSGQNPHAAAMAAASWAEASWRPNAIQRRVRPGVVVVHVAPGNQLTPPGLVPGAVVPSAVWTVDSASGKVETAGNPPGSPPASEMKRAAAALMRGVPAPSLGELDLAEKGVMQLRTSSMPRAFGGILGLLLLFFAVRYGLSGLASLLAISAYLGAGSAAFKSIYVLGLVFNVVMLAGIALGAALVFNVGNLALRLPGFASPTAATRNLAWGGYVAGMIALAVVIDGVLPSVENRSLAAGAQGQYTHVAATVDDDGSETYVAIGGDLTVDLSKWPSSQWVGVQFKTSNPSVLSLDATPAAGAAPKARFGAHEAGVSRVDASSADGTYTFQLRVDVGPPP